MFKLNDIRDNFGARVKRKTLGRGIGSGLGKTSGRGGKGQTARSGVSLNGFEGGQTPIYRRMPKRGFNNFARKKLYELDFFKITRLLKSGKISAESKIDRSLLIDLRMMPSHMDGISLIANGLIETKIHVVATRASAKAKEMLEAAGGTFVVG